MIGVSACLAGVCCRYDGTAKPDQRVTEMVKNGEAFAFCSECLAGLKIPRAPSEISGGDGGDVLQGRAPVLSKDGEDRTKEFIKAAEKSLLLCRKKGIDEVWLKAKSPSCGVNKIYDGTFSGVLRGGMGVTAAVLQKNGIKVVEID